MKLIAFYTLALLSLLASQVRAAEPEVMRLNKVIDAALEVIYGPSSMQHSLEEKRVKVRAVIEAEYDLDVIIRRAIGRNWALMEAAEQAQVLELIKQLVVKAYVQGMQGKSRPKIQMGEMISISDKRVEIPSVVFLGEQAINVLYRLGRMESGWQIYDIVAEDISVVANYRKQLDDHFRRGNAAALIAKLEELLKKEDLDENIEL